MGEGQLVVTDEAGTEVLDTEGAGMVTTDVGIYTFTCTLGTESTTSTLRSVPAS